MARYIMNLFAIAHLIKDRDAFGYKLINEHQILKLDEMITISYENNSFVHKGKIRALNLFNRLLNNIKKII